MGLRLKLKLIDEKLLLDRRMRRHAMFSKDNRIRWLITREIMTMLKRIRLHRVMPSINQILIWRNIVRLMTKDYYSKVGRKQELADFQLFFGIRTWLRLHFNVQLSLLVF